MFWPRRNASMRAWRARRRPRKTRGTATRQQLEIFLVRWKARFLVKSAPACLLKGVESFLTREATSSKVRLPLVSWLTIDACACGPSLTGICTATLNWPPGATPSGTSTWKAAPSISIVSFAPAVAPKGAVARCVTVRMPLSLVSTTMRRPSSSVPHTTLKVVPPGDVRGSSEPTGTITLSPDLSSTWTILFCSMASSRSLWRAMLRNTSSRVDMDSCTSVIPMAPRLPSRVLKNLDIFSSSDVAADGTLKCI
mmetsp:Transcript_48839/g.119000  ORF Transcript_48839/g.119000 Transcript_48839/m.119000 type:complete len:253 (+) Transcript_48839:3220-3978(+)